jgi:hypothetical protein
MFLSPMNVFRLLRYSPVYIKTFCYKNFNEELFCKDLAQIPWDIIDVFDDVDDVLDAWYNLNLEVVDKHSPWREKRVKRQKQPDWLTNEIMQCIAMSNHFKSLNDMVNYKTLRNRCVSLIRNAKTNHYQTCIESDKGDSKKLWQYLRDVKIYSVKFAK